MPAETPLWTPNAPVRTPTESPWEAPERRLHPGDLCNDQKSRVVRRIIRELP